MGGWGFCTSVGGRRVLNRRLEWLLNKKIELRDANVKEHERLDKFSAKVMKSKDFALLRWLVEHFKCPDVDLVDDVIKGFDLIDWPSDSNVFEPGLYHQPLAEHELVESDIGIMWL